MKNIIFIAPPAAGKGTVSSYLVDNYGYGHISTGDLLRDEIKKGTSLGLEIKSQIDQGNLVPDETINTLLENRLTSIDGAFILDGYPRNLKQALNIVEILNKINNEYVVINIDIDKDILEKRITGRLSCPNCKSVYNIYFENIKPLKENICDKCGTTLVKRDDDNLEAFTKRYQIYLDESVKALEYFEGINKVNTVNGNQPIENVIKEIERIISEG